MRYIVAVDIGGTAVKSGVIRDDGFVMYKQSMDSVKGRKDYPLVQKIELAIEDIINFSKEKQWKIEGIAISAAGQINRKTGEVLYAVATIPGWTGTQLKTILSNKFNLPVVVENDANASAIAEKWIGAGKEFDKFVCFTIGTGIGGGIIYDGKLLGGEKGIAGELGHIPIRGNGKRCSCGNNGCWEQYASMTALVDQVKEKISEGINGEKVLQLVDQDVEKINGKVIFEVAEQGDTFTKNCIQEWVEYIADGIISLIHILNPEAIIIGGGVSAQGENLLNPIRECVKSKGMPMFTKDLQILSAKLNNDAGMIGAARSFFYN